MKKALFVFTVVLIGSLSASAQTFSKHTLKATYISTGRLDTTLSFGLVPIDAANTVNCPGTTGKCLVQADMWLQALGSQDGNLAGLCFVVDGVSQACPAVNNVPNGSLGILTNSLSATVSAGNHTVQTVLYTLFGTNVGGYNFNYRVYKP